ncbi:MAG: IS607 family transposase [Bacillota bacterium]
MDRLLTLSEASLLLGVSPSTIRFWDRTGRIRCVRTAGGRRRVPESEVMRLRGEVPAPARRVVALYARVSSHDQKAKGDLDRQVLRLREGARALGLPEPEHVITDVASGLSDKRRGLRRLMQLAQEGGVTDVVITYRDRLTRFGFGYLARYFDAFRVTVHVVDGEEDRKSLHEELVDDLLAIVTSFSGKLYGLRGHKKARELVARVKEVVQAEGDV